MINICVGIFKSGEREVPVRLAILLITMLVQAGFGTVASATSIVAVRTPTAVVIAADSLLTIRGGEKPLSAKVCKIFQGGRFFFTLSGFYKDPDRDFDISALIPTLLDQEQSLVEAANAVTSRVAASLQTEMLRLRAEAPVIFTRNFPGEGQVVLKLLYAGFDDDQPVTLLQTFRYTMTHPGDVAVSSEKVSCPGECNPAVANFYFLTERAAIDEYLATKEPLRLSPEETARLFVDLEVKSGAADTGPPVDVLRIDRSGGVWIARKEECPDIAATQD